MGLFSRRKIGGIIAYLDLEDFWLSCTKEEQDCMIRWHQNAMGGSLHPSPIVGKIDWSTRTRLQYLTGIISTSTSEHLSAFRNKALSYAEKYCYDAGRLIDKHFYLQAVAESFYKERDTNPSAIETCIEYCKRDIELFPKYRKPLDREMDGLPRIATFQRLAIIYEKQGQIDEAIKICKKALKYKLRDSTKGGYEGRIEKLEKKRR